MPLPIAAAGAASSGLSAITGLLGLGKGGGSKPPAQMLINPQEQQVTGPPQMGQMQPMQPPPTVAKQPEMQPLPTVNQFLQGI
jgi:hypothetical protein